MAPYACCVTLFLLLRFVHNSQEIRGQVNFNACPGHRNLCTVNNFYKRGFLRIMTAVTDSEGKPPHMLPSKNDKQRVGLLDIWVDNGHPVGLQDVCFPVRRVENLWLTFVHRAGNKNL